MSSPPGSVAAYYDRNTRAFLRFGRSGSALAIHRGVWAPGVTGADQAARWINQRLGGLCPPRARVIDLGCGVGGSLVDLARSRPDLEGWGLTISTEQVALGTQFLHNAGLDSRLRLLAADFTQPWPLATPVNLAYAVESLIHVDDDAVLDHVARALEPGGTFVVCDDFLEVPGPSTPSLEDFRRCWYARGLRSSAALIEACAARGLVLTENRDLTPWLRLRRPQDLLVGLAAPVARWFSATRPGAQNLVGGNALNQLLRSGTLAYRLLAFKK